MRINADLLTQAINEHKDIKFQEDFREWLVYTAPPEVQAIFKNYTEKLERSDEQAREYVKNTEVIRSWVMIAAVLFVLFMLYQTIFTIPTCR